MRIIGMGAHPDDVWIGCGGTLSKYKAKGNFVDSFSMSRGRSDPIDQRFDTIPLVDIVSWVANLITLSNPDIIFTHCSSDVNRDHRIINEAVLVAIRQSLVKEIYAFDITSFWSFNQFGSFNPNVFVDITDTIDQKIEGLKEFGDEIEPFPHYRSIENIRAFAQRWGSVITVPYAEAFELVRCIK